MADLYYIDEGYYDSGYFVYTANAQAQPSSNFTFSCNAQSFSIVEAAASLTSTVTQTATATRIKEGVIDFAGVFTASMTVNASRDGDVDLTTTFTWSADGDVNRSAAIALSNIANLNAQAARTTTAQASMAVAASLTADGIRPEEFSASLSLEARFSVRGSLRYERPLQVEDSTGSYVTTSDKKFGAGSLAVETTTARLNYYTDNSMLMTGNFTSKPQLIIEFWYNPSYSSTRNDILFDFWDGTNSQWRILGNTNFVIRRNNGTEITLSGTYSSANTWHHMLYFIDGTNDRISFFRNGTRVNTSAIGGANSESIQTGLFRISPGTGSTSPIGFIDEVRVLCGSGLNTFTGYNSGSTTITVPTQPFVNDATYTRFLGHFDIDFRDDVSLTQTASASLSSTASLSAQANEIANGGASLSAIFASEALGGKIVTGQSNLSASYSQTANVNKITDSDIDLNGVFGQETNNIRIRLFDLALSSEFTQTALQSVTRDAVVDQSAAFTSSIAIRATKVGDIDLDVVADLAATGAKTTGYASALTSTASQSTDINVIRDAVLNITEFIAAFDTTPTRVRLFESALAAEFAQSTTANKIKTNEVALSATFTQSTTAQKTVNAQSTPSTAFTQTAYADRLADAVISLSIAATQTVSGLRTRSFESALSAEFAQTSSVNKTTDTASTQSAAFTQSVLPVKTVDAIVQEDVIATQITVIALIANKESHLTVTASLTAVIGRRFDLPANETWINYGISSQTYDKYPRILMSFDRDPLFDQIKVSEDGFTLSIWARRDTIETDQFQPMVSQLSSSGTHWGAFTFWNNDIVLRQNFDPDEPNPTWSNASTDTEWHHYLFYTTLKGQPENTGTPYYRLWRDGVYQGEKTYSAYNESVQFSSGQYLTMGRASIAEFDLPYDLTLAGSDLDFAQVWLGKISSSSQANWSPSVDYFYDGDYVELFDDGRGEDDRLPQPFVYNRLDQPWTDIEFIGYDNSERAADQPLASPWTSWFTLNTTTSGVFLYTANLSAAAALTAQAGKQVEATASLAVTATMVTAIEAIRSPSVSLSSSATQTALVNKTTDTASTQSAEFALTAEVGDLDSTSADLSAIFELECSAVLIEPTRASAELQSEFTLTTSIDIIVNNTVSLSATFTQTADVTLIEPIRAEANLSVSASMTVIIGAIEENIVLLVSAGTMTTDADRLADAFVTMPVVATSSAEVSRAFRTTSAVLQVQGFQVTVGDIINLDPGLTLTVKQEQRELIILPETRQFDIASETRTLIINKG